jgi:hypothetical protein
MQSETALREGTMVDHLTARQKRELQETSQAVALKLARGVSKEKIVAKLMKQGWLRDKAMAFVNDTEQRINEILGSPEKRREQAQEYGQQVLHGFLWMAGGVMVSVVTYAMASSSPSGGVYVVAWGAILFGLIKAIRGLVGGMKYGGNANEDFDEERQEFTCSECGADIVRQHQTCPNCGSEIDWGEVWELRSDLP